MRCIRRALYPWCKFVSRVQQHTITLTSPWCIPSGPAPGQNASPAYPSPPGGSDVSLRRRQLVRRAPALCAPPSCVPKQAPLPAPVPSLPARLQRHTPLCAPLVRPCAPSVRPSPARPPLVPPVRPSPGACACALPPPCGGSDVSLCRHQLVCGARGSFARRSFASGRVVIRVPEGGIPRSSSVISTALTAVCQRTRCNRAVKHITVYWGCEVRVVIRVPGG